jgi:TonB family protein
MSGPHRFLLLPFVIAAVSYAAADDLDRHLQDRYLNKTFVLHGFYSGSHLRYDLSGSLVSGNRQGDWTSDGFVMITEIGVKKHEIRMKARRVSIVSENKTLSLRVAENEYVRPGEEKGIFVGITANLQKKPSSDQVDSAMANIFLSAKDQFASLLPDYWKPCVVAALAGSDELCHFSSDVLSIPGVGFREGASREDAGTPEEPFNGDARPGPLNRGPFRAKGITPPKLTLHKEPEFSELARRMKYQGTGVLGLTVDRDGLPTNIHVLNPLGCGLDAQAVQAVEGWRFKPAEKNGQPIEAEIAVEVDFHLY